MTLCLSRKNRARDSGAPAILGFPGALEFVKIWPRTIGHTSIPLEYLSFVREMPPRHFERVDEMEMVLWIYGIFVSYASICRVLLYDTLIRLDQKRLCNNR